MTTASILHSRVPGEGLALPLVLAGYPSAIEGRPCYYRRKESIRAGDWVHRGKREPFSVPVDRIDRWVAEYNRRAAAGIKVPITKRHTLQPTAEDTVGYAVSLKREGDSLYADMQLIGDDALSLAARNDVSIWVEADGIDAKGNPSGEHLHHIALTPNPNQPHLGPFVTIAASAAGTPTEAPVFELCACEHKETPMKPETLQKLRAKFDPGNEMSDGQLAERAAEAALADPPKDQSAEIVRLSADVDSLKRERDEARGKVTTLELSADAAKPRDPDPMSLALITRAFKTDRERVIESGVVSEAGMKELDALLLPGGKPNGVSLSLSAGSADPLYTRVCEILRRNPGVKTANAVNRGNAADPPRHESLDLSGDARDSDEGKPVTPERRGELLALAGYNATAVK